MGSWRKPFFHLLVVFSIAEHVADAANVRNRRETDKVPIEIDEIIADLGPRKQTDLVLVIDRSTGMGKERFYMKEKKLLQSIVTQYATVHPDYVRIAAITFAKHSTIDFDFIQNDPVTKCALFEGDNPPWRDLQYIRDPAVAHGTNIYDGLLQADAILTAGRASRPGAEGVILLVTDGDYGTGDTDPYNTAEELKRKGYKMYAVGIGSWLRPGSVRILASDAAYYADYDAWEQMTRTNLTSADPDTPALWAVAGSECSLDCGEHADCVCNIDMGYHTCLCKPGYFKDADTCTACPVGTYKENYGNEAYTSCPYGHVTPSNGTTNKSQCQCDLDTCNDLCAADPCGPNEICLQVDETTVNCTCPTGFSGAGCQDNPSDCFVHMCQNGGKCVDGLGESACVCPWGYRGQYCEVNEDECLEEPCENNSTCVDGRNRFQCQCPYGWRGTFCHDKYETTTTAPSTTTPTTTPSTTPSTTVSSSTTSSTTATPTSRGNLILSTTPTPTPTPGPSQAPSSGEDNTQMYIIIGASAGGGVLLLVALVIAIVCIVQRHKDDGSESASTRHVLDSPNTPRFEKNAGGVKKNRGGSLYNTISHKFTGMWRKKTVRGSSPWLDADSGKKGLPSVPARRPDVIEDTNLDEAEHVVEYAVINDQEIRVDVGMGGWEKLLLEMEQTGVMDSGIICKLNSEERAATPQWNFSWDEISRLEILMDEGETNVPAVVQGGEYVLVENDGTIALARTIGERQVRRAAVIGKTKNYLVVGVVDNQGDQSATLKKEIQWFVDHIQSEGY